MLIVLLSLMGVASALMSRQCVKNYAIDPADARVIGRVSWPVIGVIGYTLIAASQFLPGATQVLAIGLVPITAWLVYKGWKEIMLDCPFCPLAWVVNLALAICAFIPAAYSWKIS